MNGDGLLDPIVVRVDSVRYWLNYGYGRWSDPIDLPAPINAAERSLATLEDLNGDGLADLVIVNGGTVKYAINRNGRAFFSIQTLTSQDIPDLPVRGDHTTVLLADMNANGSEDVVWIEPDGTVRYLELFPVRPNLLSHIENGIGLVMDVHYSASVQELARDRDAGQPWTTPLPHPMLVVDQVDTFDRLSDVHEIDRYHYHDGFYDGVEKQFRGYRRVEKQEVGDDSHESGLTSMTYDVGDQDAYRHGLLLSTTVQSGGAEGDARTLAQTSTTYRDCPVAEIPPVAQLDQPVRFVCQVQADNLIVEGDPTDQVATRQTMAYDGYGNVVHSENLGVTSVGGHACDACDRDASVFGAPCGPECTGDETYADVDFVAPGAATNQRWILHAPIHQRTYGRMNGLQTETTTFYDGPAFQGLPEGHLDLGDVTRVQAKVADGQVIQQARNQYDGDGNVVATLDPLGQPNGNTHQRRYAYDDEGLRVVRTDILLGDSTLRRETSYDPLFRKVSENTAWMRVQGDQMSARRSSFFTYDQHGRVSSRVLPGGDTVDNPTEQFMYELGDPVSRVLVRKRSQVGGQYDLETVQCLDGRGRQVQTRTRLAAGRYQVSGFTVYDNRAQPVRTYQPYVSESGDCEDAPPQGVAFQAYTYDATDRPLTTTEPDADLYGTPTVTRTEYLPLTTLAFDGDDADLTNPFHDTPLVTRHDGLGRVVSIERRLDPMGEPAKLTARYDELGRLRGYVDDQGNEKVQTYDLIGRLLTIDDPDAGTMAYTYDDAGNVVESVDGRGVATRQAFDGANRRVARWDDADEAGTKVEWVYDAAPGCPAEQCTNTEGMLAEVRYPGLDLGPDGLSNAPGRERTGYDVRGRPVSFERVLEGHAFAQTLRYDNADRLLGATFPDGHEIRRSYDDASRLTAIPDVIGEVDYDDRGLTTSVKLADGTTDAWTYDSRMRPVGMRTTAGGAVLQGVDYTRDRVGNITRIADAGHAHGPGEAAEQIHDAWYRLTEIRYGDETVRYAYDTIDHITSQTSTVADSAANVGDYTYGDGAGPNAVTQAGSMALAYDEAGNVTERGGVALTWDHLERLTAAGDAGRFYYGADADRLARDEGGSVTHYALPDFDVRDGVSALYVRAGGHRVARLESAALAKDLLGDPNGNGEVDAGDAWAVQQGQPGAPADRLLWSAVRRQLVDDAPTFLHAGHLGSLTLATSAGEVTGQRAYYPTGEERPGSFGWVDEYGFTGQERDGSTGLVHFRGRYLDPAIGRWTEPDPLFTRATPGGLARLGQSTTAYAYVANELGDAVDPNGLEKTGRVSPMVEAHNTRLRARGPKPGGPGREVAKLGRNLNKARDQIHADVQAFVAKKLQSVQGKLDRNTLESFTELGFEHVKNQLQARINETARNGGDLRALQAYGRVVNESFAAFQRFSVERQGGVWNEHLASLPGWTRSWQPEVEAPRPAPVVHETIHEDHYNEDPIGREDYEEPGPVVQSPLYAHSPNLPGEPIYDLTPVTRN
jgi:RHS repeat-associated protein